MNAKLNNSVTVAETTLDIVEYLGQRVVTFAMIDQVHGRPEGTARKRFNDNKSHFVEGEDYFDVGSSEIRTHNICTISDKSHGNIKLMTESGYLMLVKSFTDDLAWKVQKTIG